MQSGKLIMIVGALIFLGGLIWYFFGDKLQWLGKLPGDIRVEKQNFSFYFPITTMILLSLLITGISIIIRKFF